MNSRYLVGCLYCGLQVLTNEIPETRDARHDAYYETCQHTNQIFDSHRQFILRGRNEGTEIESKLMKLADTHHMGWIANRFFGTHKREKLKFCSNTGNVIHLKEYKVSDNTGYSEGRDNTDPQKCKTNTSSD